MTKRISIINFKGGVGKTTLAFNLGAGLSKFYDKRVLLVDVDHQSSLSLVCLNEKQWNDTSKTGKTVNSIFRHFTTPGTPMPGKEIIFYKPKSSYPKLDLVPCELQLDETELDLGTTGFGDPVLSEWNKRMLIAKWMENNKIDADYDYILFDCPPATKIVTQNAIAVSHGYIIPTIPDVVSTRGIPHLIERMFAKIDEKLKGLATYLKSKGMEMGSLYVPETKLGGIVIFRIRTHGPAYSGYVDDHTANLAVLNGKYGATIIKPYIEEGVGVIESLRDGNPIYDCGYNPNVTNRGYIQVFTKLTEECKKRIDAI
jgi:chromosome partitioning protein